MDMNNYMDYAKAHGYDIQYTGIGMAYLTIGQVKLTETKDVNEIRKELVMIGMAIMSDTLRSMDAEDFSESEASEEDEDEWEADDLSQEDYLEWCASSCGTTYNAYIGKPWLD